MKYLSCLSLLLSSSVLLSFSSYVAADDSTNNSAVVAKPLSVGIGTYASILATDDPFVSDSEFSGIALTVGYTISDQFLIRGTYFSLEDDDFSDIESSGIDLLGYLGTGLTGHGFKAYIGGGIFKDEIKISGFGSEDFSGLQLSGGFGYNWDSVSLDLIVGIRDSSDYEDSVNGLFDITAVSSSLLLSARF